MPASLRDRSECVHRQCEPRHGECVQGERVQRSGDDERAQAMGWARGLGAAAAEDAAAGADAENGGRRR